MSTHKAINQLPSLPQILVRILDTIQTETADFQQLADIIRQDPAITTKIISIANSSYFGRSNNCSNIERALMFLGTETVKTIVITAAIKQFFNNFDQSHSQFIHQFWQRSLISANFAKTLASLTSYHSPDEAYLCGLLTNLGELILLTEDSEHYLKILNSDLRPEQLLHEEQKLFQQSHGDVAADLIDSWEISDFMGDAVRYHHENIDQIQDAHHLVKIIYLSSLMAKGPLISAQQITASYELFGLNESLTRELHSRIAKDISHIARELGIELDSEKQLEEQQLAHKQLGQRLNDINELAQFNQSLSHVDQHESLKQTISRTLLLTFGIENCLLFEHQTDKHILVNHINDQASKSTLTINVQPGRSMTSDAILTKDIQHSLLPDKKALSVIDKQLLRLCKEEQLLCLPLINKENNNQAIGVLVLGLNKRQFDTIESRFGQLIILGQEIASTLQKINSLNFDTQQQTEIQISISEAVHEASNPLSIIRNYLEMLRIQLGEDHKANDKINHIKNEIDRVGDILLQLQTPNQGHSTEEKVDINSVIKETCSIFSDSLYASKNIKLNVILDTSIGPCALKSGYLKQILTNLLKNACEALSSGDEVSIRSEATLDGNGNKLIAIIINDNGPGIPQAIKEQLFKPVQSTKKGSHSGLGLSIVKKLMDEMGGTINCQTYSSNDAIIKKGTEFQLLIPQ